MDEIEALRRVRADQAEPSSSAVESGRDALLERVRGAKGGRAGGRASRLRLGGRAPWVLGAFIATGAAVVALVATIGLNSGGGPVVGQAGQTPSVDAGEAVTASEFLADAARQVRETGDPVLAPGEFLRVESRTLQAQELAPEGVAGGQPDWYYSSIREFYIPADSSAEWVTMLVGVSYEQVADADAALVAADIEDFQAREAEMHEEAGLDPAYERAAGGKFLSTQFSAHEVAGIEWSQEPAVALQQVYDLSGVNVGREMGALRTIGELLQPGIVDAATRAVLLEAAALIPGSHLLDAPVDFSGRQGVAIAVDGGTGFQYQLVFNSETGLPMGVRAVGAGRDGTGETVVWDSNGYSSSIVSFAP